ncbi:XRE family transcriptional regulator [Ureibacillus massiliensis 4400831 = CIP 108448 = CCUG 49529]|uniref:XRE family transcriptional regulator n=1 Tax=Ureibacillus massiliensis 4400831 = CIP 108448 = CCUG 49529 TaxID=1211035 RepID=A0A0A3IYJ1_9BACL|nr:response regulator transcription factor [Ureibacillus massiliensis]KGR87978.1 XRE family transcriptional regulator [Ureibacillus massiliensis 4400831 = CIP 108448 = CCUG 49529]BDH63570.1 DNA-binding response regulator [Lysinibacillus sp. PLM2]
MNTILLVDDEQRMLDLIELFLLPLGMKCIKETTGINSVEIIEKEKVDLVLLDVMMPEMNGWEVCKAIREFSNVPIIMLTARSDKADLVNGLNIGADDYITKPFDERELVARVNALLRRTSDSDKSTITYFDFTLDCDTYSLHYQDSTAQLTLKEFNIIKALISRPTKTYTREELLEIAWNYEADTDIRTVDSHIRNLREKLREAKFPTEEFLKTAWGIGYKWN